MRKSIIGGAAVAATLALAGTAQADSVQSISAGPWTTTNSTVIKTPDGVHFGTYADGGAVGGSIKYSGANGKTLSDVNDFSYTFNYKQAGNVGGAAPYARIYLDSDHDGVKDSDVVLEPSFCDATNAPAQGTDLSYQMVGNSVRYNDDPCDHGQQSWADVVDDHGDDTITSVLVTQGFSTGTDVSGMLKQITFNGETFSFVGAPQDGEDGAPGHDGVDGATGAAGKDGVNGANGANGAVGKDGVTTIVHGAMRGNKLRTIHAPSIKKWKFIKVRATLRGKHLQTHHRAIKVDLRGKGVGNYDVRMTIKYKDETGTVRTVHSVRTLSVFHS